MKAGANRSSWRSMHREQLHSGRVRPVLGQVDKGWAGGGRKHAQSSHGSGGKKLRGCGSCGSA